MYRLLEFWKAQIIVVFIDLKLEHMYMYLNTNKRAQRALGRSPEENVKGHSGANNREPHGHNLNNLGRGPFDDVIYEIWKLWAL